MDIQDKGLLLKDICARLPYGVKIETTEGIQIFDIKWLSINMANIKNPYLPYIRPMSSMTEAEFESLNKVSCYSLEKTWSNKIGEKFEIGSKEICCDETTGYEYMSLFDMSVCIDWLNEHHFDYRGLIKKGLALEAPADMYNERLN